MRWNRNRPKVGDVRDIKYFAWSPVRIGTETRWLEYVITLQKYEDRDLGYAFSEHDWVDKEFLNR
jgi:hypothetical protein